MSAQAYFVLGKADNAVLVPYSALTSKDTGKQEKKKADKEARKGDGEAKATERRFMVQVLKDGHVEEREVSVGVMTRTRAQVLAGLTEGETVYVNTPDDKKKVKQIERGLPRLAKP